MEILLNGDPQEIAKLLAEMAHVPKIEDEIAALKRRVKQVETDPFGLNDTIAKVISNQLDKQAIPTAK